MIAPDLMLTKSLGLDYMPVIFPGFSWHNLMGAGSPLNQIPRYAGNFYWHQIYNAVSANCTMVFGAMFDEMDEGTAIFKITNDPPVGDSPFVTYEGLSSDHYLWLAGQGGKLCPLSTTR